MSQPPRKIRKVEEEKRSPSEGVIRLEIENVSTLDDEGVYSLEIKVAGTPWRLNVLKEGGDGEYWLSSYLYSMDNSSTLWSIEAKAKNVIIHPDSSKNFIEEDDFTYDQAHDSWGFKLLDWNGLTSQGFVTDGKITVEVRFWITNMRGIRSSPQVDFTDSSDPRHDLILLIGGHKIYVSKQILAYNSPVLNSMFYGNFDEKDKKEIELTDIDLEEFIAMLRVIYPPYEKITDANVDAMLRLGDFFQIKVVLDRAEEHLLKSEIPDIASEIKLLLSDQYRLIDLQDHCLKQLDTLKKVKKVKMSSEFEDLSETTKVALLESMCKLVDADSGSDS